MKKKVNVIKSKSRTIKKISIYVFVLCLVVLAFFALLNISDKWDIITGAGTASDTTTLSVTIGNTAPTIYYVYKIEPASPAATESSQTQVNISFCANDTNGEADLNTATAEMHVYFNDSEENRTDTSCILNDSVAGDSGSRCYNCTIDMEFYDTADDWVMNASIYDNSNAEALNNSTTFTYGSTLAIDTGPSSMIWSSFVVTAVNQLSSSNPFQVNNTANSDIVIINVTAIDLLGNETAEYIYAANFSVNTANACDSGMVLTNKTNGTALCDEACSTLITGAAVKHGNNSFDDIYFCIEAVNHSITAQAYNATGGDAWTIIADEG